MTKKGLTVLITLVFITLLSGALAGQGLQHLSLDQAIEMALANHPHLRKAELAVTGGEARVTYARSRSYPQVNSGGVAKQGLSGSGAAFGLEGLANSPEPDDMAVSVNAYYDVLDFGRTKHETSARKRELMSLQHQLSAVEAEVIRDVRKAYFTTLTAAQLVEVAERNLEATKLNLRQAEAFFRAGLRSKIDVHLAQAEVSRAQLRLTQTQNEHAVSLAGLSHAMGAADSSAQFQLEEPDLRLEEVQALPVLIAAGLANRPELRALEAQIEAREAWVERAKKERYPRIMVAFSGGWTRFAELSLSNLLFGGFAIKLPVFAGGQLKASIQENEQAQQQAIATRNQLLQDIPLEITAVYHQLSNSTEAVRIFDEMKTYADDALRLARARYRMELADRVELALVQASQAEAESEYFSALYDYEIQTAELRYRTGQTFWGSAP